MKKLWDTGQLVGTGFYLMYVIGFRWVARDPDNPKACPDCRRKGRRRLITRACARCEIKWRA